MQLKKAKKNRSPHLFLLRFKLGMCMACKQFFFLFLENARADGQPTFGMGGHPR